MDRPTAQYETLISALASPKLADFLANAHSMSAEDLASIQIRAHQIAEKVVDYGLDFQQKHFKTMKRGLVRALKEWGCWNCVPKCTVMVVLIPNGM